MHSVLSLMLSGSWRLLGGSDGRGGNELGDRGDDGAPKEQRNLWWLLPDPPPPTWSSWGGPERAVLRIQMFYPESLFSGLWSSDTLSDRNTPLAWFPFRLQESLEAGDRSPHGKLITLA